MNVLVCGIVNETGECNTDFAMSIINMPFEIQGHNLHVTFAPSYESALQSARDSDITYDRVIVMPTSMSSRDFMHRAIVHGHDRIIYGVYGLPGIDWAKVADNKPGCSYNIQDAVLDRKPDAEGYVALDASDHPYITKPLSVFALDGKFVHQNVQEFHAHERAFIDVRAPLVNVARVGFLGCVGLRGQVR